MKALVFKKEVSRDFAEVKRITTSIDKMLDHVPVEVDGNRVWDHGCRASYNLNHSGSYDLVIMSDSIKTSKPVKVHVLVQKAEQDFHLPYKRLKVKVVSSKNRSNVLKVT